MKNTLTLKERWEKVQDLYAHTRDKLFDLSQKRQIIINDYQKKVDEARIEEIRKKLL